MLITSLTLALAVTAAPLPAPAAARQDALKQRMKRPFIDPIPETSVSNKTADEDEDDVGPLNVGGPGDAKVLEGAKLASADDDLIAFFKKRTPPAPDREKIAELIKKLSDKDEKVASAAQGELIAIGLPSLPMLRTTANNTDDPEAATRAKFCIKQLDPSEASNLVINAARLLATRKPAGACEVLLGYLPFAEDELTYAEVEHALISVAMKGGKPDPALVKAMKDPLALRRASAAQVLATAGGTAYYDDIRPLLKDAKPSVRLKAALGLVGAYDADAVPVLIGLMGEPPSRMRNQAERYLNNLAGEWAVSGPKGNDATSRRVRREVWEAWWKGVEPAKITEDIKERTPSEEEAEKIEKAILALNDSVTEVREKASTDLINFGKKATSLLRRAVEKGHERIAPSAARCIDAIERGHADPLPLAAPRILALRRPAGTIDALLGYVPYAETEETAAQIIETLAAIGVTAGKGDKALLDALDDKVASRRAAAVAALAKGRATENLTEMRKGLRDKDLNVQLRAAQGLAPLGDKKAVSTLIALLRDLPLDQCWEVEDLLGRIAGDKAPSATVSEDKDSRAKALESWAKWWTDNSKDIELTKLDLSTGERELGLYLIVENYNNWTGRSSVQEIDKNGKVRWKMDQNISGAYDAQVLRNGNILLIENQNRLTERDKKGNIVGIDKYYNQVFQAERLRNGDTFLACRQQLLIIDSKGNEKFKHTHTGNTIMAGSIFRDGTMAYINYSGQYTRIDRTGKTLKTFTVPNFSANGACVLPGDRVIVSHSNMLREYTSDAKVVWESKTTNYPLMPYRTPRGNTVVSHNSQRSILEIDSRGKTVRDLALNQTSVYRVTKR